MSVACNFTYVGSELELFSAASNWKNYLHSHLAEYLGPQVLEVGAGFGGSTRALARARHDQWVCLEPDAVLASRLKESIECGCLPAYCELRTGTLANLAPAQRFDSILYIDVLEHIENDASEISRAASHLSSDGHLIVLCPAHQCLYSPFDKAIGHFRRYNKCLFRSLSCEPLELVRLRYLDSVGLLASVGNRLLLSQSMPTEHQIAIWDKTMVPLSRWLDVLTCYSLGKSILGVWRRSSVSGPEKFGGGTVLKHRLESEGAVR